MEHRRPLRGLWSEILANQPTVTIGEVADRVANRGFGVLLVVLALPTLIPVLPPGSATLIGFLYVLLALQMLRGAERPWLPKRIRAYRMSSETIVKLRQVSEKIFQQIERVSRPRAIGLPNQLTSRLVGAGVLVVGLVLLSPIPFLHSFPGLTVLILGTGLLNNDGILVFAGLMLIFAILGIVVFGGSALHAFFHHF
jgi:hypothetical protein